MRVQILFKAHKLPIIYRHRFMALIKEALNRADSHYKETLYPEKTAEKSKIAKPFTFSVMMPSDRKMVREKIPIDNGVEIEDMVFYFPEGGLLSFIISSSDYEFIINLYNGVLEMGSFDFFPEIKFRLHRVMPLKEKNIQENEVTFKTLSPILIETKDEKPLIPDSQNLHLFNQEFNSIHDRILKDIRGHGLSREMEFTPVKIKKQIVKHTLKGFREKTGKPYMTLTCFEGCFKLGGDPEDLQLLYQTGIGLRTGQGFGMVEVV